TNVEFFSKDDASHVAALVSLEGEMEHRYGVQSRRSVQGLEPTMPFRHKVLIFDEYGAFKESLAAGGTALSEDEAEVDKTVTRILQKGRAARIHLVFISQSIYAETIPGKQITNFGGRLSIGRPAQSTTLHKVAGDA